MSDLFHTNCPHCGQPMPNGNNSPFDAFWQDVPHKIGREASRKAWGKLSSADRQAAHGTVKSWYTWFAKTYPTAAPVHPATYLNGKRWQDVTCTQSAPQRGDKLKASAAAIRSGRKYLCTHIPPSVVRECLDAGLVTAAECQEVGVI